MELIVKSFILLALVRIQVQSDELNAVRFTNMKCELNPDYGIITDCKIIINKDRQTVLTGGGELTKELPTIMNKVQIYKWSNGYKPAFLKTTVDICQYFNGRGGVVSKLVRKASEPFMTRNYSCPILPDWYNTSFTTPDLRLLPSIIPFGNYLCSMTFYDGTLTTKYGKIEIFVNIFENFKVSALV